MDGSVGAIRPWHGNSCCECAGQVSNPQRRLNWKTGTFHEIAHFRGSAGIIESIEKTRSRVPIDVYGVDSNPEFWWKHVGSHRSGINRRSDPEDTPPIFFNPDFDADVIADNPYSNDRQRLVDLEKTETVCLGLERNLVLSGRKKE